MKEGKRQRTRKPSAEEFALVSTKDFVPFPGLVIPLYLEKGHGFEAVEFALKHNRQIIVTLDRSGNGKIPKEKDFASVGVVGKIVQHIKLTGGEWKLRIELRDRVLIKKFLALKPFPRVQGEVVAELPPKKSSRAWEKFAEDVKEKFSVLLQYDPSLEESVVAAVNSNDPGALADVIASSIPIIADEAQKILEEFDAEKRLKLASKILTTHINVLNIRERVADRAQHELGRMHHRELLKEQIRQIQEELGEENPAQVEFEELEKRIASMALTGVARKEAERQLQRLKLLHPDASEAALVRTYLDWILDLPWSKRTKDRSDLDRAKAVLEEEHFGLEKTKERILDFLGVRKLRHELKGPILLLVGPPGVGKTSLGRSIAKALGRKFVRISVGGLRDEAELRGHRRTYVGALPGKIIQGLKTAGTKNPVFLLDELDKIGSDFRGDPASALLEVLDPEQNKSFEDHYLNIPFDLSEVMFIGTANITDTVPPALLDRVEVIEIPGYTAEEKLQISRRYLIPQEQEENGLKDAKILMPDETVTALIQLYTRESGVRELRRVISGVFRKVARSVAEGEKAPTKVTTKLVEQYLGPAKYILDHKQARDEIGVVTGLAWTPVGGETLTVEASITPGKGSLSLTGQLGEVMRESAMAALTYILSNADRLGIDPSFYDHSNVHIHVPQGAIAKDGPSAGVAIAVALVSLLTERPVSRDVAMTGEITLRGSVLAIGGLREKALAALRIGIPQVLFPEENKRELIEFPPYLLKQLTFTPIRHVDEALELALKPAGARVRGEIERAALPRGMVRRVTPPST